MVYSKDQLKKWSGGRKARTTYKVPVIKFNGNSGKFMKFPAGDFKNGTELTDVELTILRFRRAFTSFEKIPGGGSLSLFTNEHNDWGDHLTVFESKTGQQIKSVGSGTIEDLRIEFPTLRINSNLYCLYEGEVYKLVVRGKSRQSLVDKQKELAKDNLEFFEKKIKLVPKQETGTGGNVYYFLQYEVIENSNLDEVGPHMEKIAEIMDKMDEEFAETNKRMQEKAETSNGEASEEDIIPLDKVDEVKDEKENSEIKIDEIPF